MRSKFRVSDHIVTRTAIEIPCCDITVEKGAQGKVKFIDPDSGDLIIGLSGHYPELCHRSNIIDIPAAEVPAKITRVKSRIEQSSFLSHGAIGLGIAALLILTLHFNPRPANAVPALLPSAMKDALALPQRIQGALPLAMPSLCEHPRHRPSSI